MTKKHIKALADVVIRVRKAVGSHAPCDMVILQALVEEELRKFAASMNPRFSAMAWYNYIDSGGGAKPKRAKLGKKEKDES